MAMIGELTAVPVKLEDLFVKPEARGAGVGKAFFAELAKVAEEKVSSSHFCR